MHTNNRFTWIKHNDNDYVVFNTETLKIVGRYDTITQAIRVVENLHAYALVNGKLYLIRRNQWTV